jgi:hypothetical protein
VEKHDGPPLAVDLVVELVTGDGEPHRGHHIAMAPPLT